MAEHNHRCAVLGKPIAHSLSPTLHNAAYRALALDDWLYDKHEVGEPDLEGFLKALNPQWVGLSLTMPLKKTIQPYGEPSDTWSSALRVANTAVFDWAGTCRNGDESLPLIRLYNTDVKGIELAFRHSYRARGLRPEDVRRANAVIIGNGNTATSALAACIEMSVEHVTVVARNPGKNPELKPLADRHLGEGSIEFASMDQAANVLLRTDVAINTIPGLAADGVAEQLLKQTENVGGTLLDVVYDPRPTKLMQTWRTRGGAAIGGEEMLLYQALAQVKLMTGTHGGDSVNDGDSHLNETLEHSMRLALEEAL